jgi:hypothetical protein
VVVSSSGRVQWLVLQAVSNLEDLFTSWATVSFSKGSAVKLLEFGRFPSLIWSRYRRFSQVQSIVYDYVFWIILCLFTKVVAPEWSVQRRTKLDNAHQWWVRKLKEATVTYLRRYRSYYLEKLKKTPENPLVIADVQAEIRKWNLPIYIHDFINYRFQSGRGHE